VTYPQVREAPAAGLAFRPAQSDPAEDARVRRRWLEDRVLPIIVMALQDFDEATGDAITQLDAQTLRSSFERLFKDLGNLARARAALAESWLQAPTKSSNDEGPDGA
jgi:hypothetical protein